MDKITFDIRKIAENFQFRGEYDRAEDYGAGHINDTFAVYYNLEGRNSHRYILQRINQNVFKEPEKLMENIGGITRYMRDIIEKSGGDPLRETMNLILTRKGQDFFVDDEGDYWRAYIFVEGTTTYQTVEKPEDFYNAGKAFGRFQNLLKDYPAHDLHETIPDFHNTKIRLENFKKALREDPLNRVKDVKSEIDFVLKRGHEAGTLVDLLEKGELPLRVTHNDTKLNNVLIDNKTGEGICVVDLDTVMPGLSLYDFGDSIRFGASTAAEDERDLSKVWMDISLYTHFTRGFLEAAGKGLTQNEIDNLPLSAKMMTYECGMRFLTDHIMGDTYFKIHRPNHNLDRARTQFKLVEDMETKMEEMAEIVDKYC